MTLIAYKMIFAVLIFLTSIATILYPLKRKSALTHPESIELGEALASGIFLGAAFFHMLPDAIRTYSAIYGPHSYPIPEFICIAGFTLLLFIERLSLVRKCHLPHHSHSHSIPYFLAIILIIHALTEGAALGVGATFSETVMLLIAIVAHKGSESFALCMTMLRHEFHLKRIIVIILCFSLMTPLGILLGAFINQYALVSNGQLLTAYFNAFAAGTFLYISTLHHVRFHQHTEETQGLQEFTCLMSGLAVMAATAFWG